jgi:hypothetical protein
MKRELLYVVLFLLSLSKAFRDRLYDAVYMAELNLVGNLLAADPTILTSEPPIEVDNKDDNGRTALLMCGFDPQGVTASKLDSDCTSIAAALQARGANMSHTDPLGWNAVATYPSN